MYFAALRPAEAATLRKANLALPAEGWGELLLESSTPEAGASWTDSGQRREERQLKHRAKGETRVVPCAAGADGPAARAPGRRSVPRPTGCCSAVSGAAAGREHLLPGLAPGPGRRADGRGGGVAARAPALRPAARGGVDLAQRRGAARPRSPSGPVTASPCCCRSTPSASPARRTRPVVASPPPSARAELWHVYGTDSRQSAGVGRTQPDSARSWLISVVAAGQSSAGERRCPRWDSNPRWDPFKGPASADWATGAPGQPTSRTSAQVGAPRPAR